MKTTNGAMKRDEVLGAQDLETVLVHVPEWGGAVLVRGLTGAERDRFEESVLRVRQQKLDVNLTNVRARLVSMACVDETGARLFMDADVEILGAKSAKAIQRIFDVAAKLSGLQAGDVEELQKN